jgi:hypothetical protein
MAATNGRTEAGFFAGSTTVVPPWPSLLVRRLPQR